ncbi:hypothetical protein [Vibrio sp. SCSIO 43136]|uniref:hypothetical protein n=1 Tax=Vibrio sp. SCSIO 43136 TaxID=2819101 RepID=UPI0020751399|nr:hypothetical protein [Vibrio sp. SCSIO 43136]USD67333.1 hypothetical protein J4N39_22140 [Vibrio sp. SCSIO 43136]
MRIFKEINRNLEKQQLFFIECWASMSNVKSLDSDRVSYNNTLNSVLELLDLYSLGNKHRAPEKRKHVVEELTSFIDKDTILGAACFNGIPKKLNDIFSSHGEPLENQKELVVSLLQEVKDLLILHYRNEVVQDLRQRLADGADSGSEALTTINIKANALLSHLVTLGMPTSECYLLCRNYLKKRRDDVAFIDAFENFTSKITLDTKAYTVKLSLDNKSLFELLSRTEVQTLEDCQFEVPEQVANRNHIVNATIKVAAISYSSARQLAEKRILQALDLFSYFLGKNEIQIGSKVTVVDESGESKSLPRFDKDLSNSLDRWASDDLSIYIDAVSHLRQKGSIKTGNKISAAFRFFQNGVNEKSLESRFTAFWSALESLTLIDEDGPLRHDEHVIKAVLPCIALDYPVKQLFALRGCAKSLNWTAIGNILVQDADLGTIYNALKRKDFASEVNKRLSEHPYAQYRFGNFMELCSSPFELAQKIEAHERKVELHIHRIYRVRNAIVHNASPHERLELLIVNLEHYLRSTLNALVYMVHKSKSIKSPEEAFIRYQFEAKRIFGEMDPSRGLSGKKRNGHITSIKAGNVVIKDEQLVSWLSMHR